MMPPSPGQDIAFVERESIAGCWNSPQGASAGREMPYGFITSAHYVKTPAFVQIVFLHYVMIDWDLQSFCV